MNRSYLIAAGVGLAAVAWLASGVLGPAAAPDPVASPAASGGPMRVAVMSQEAQMVERAVVVRGRSNPIARSPCAPRRPAGSPRWSL